MLGQSLQIEDKNLFIGGDGTFVPQLGASAWDYETRFDMRLIDPFNSKFHVVDNINDKITWRTKSIEAGFYFENKDSFEFEVILKRKPPTNVLSFEIYQKNINLYPQLPLTDMDFDSVRPEKAINSIAVYHSHRTGNEYRTGKLCHIYRLKMTDFNGKWVWIDKFVLRKNRIDFILPQGFLDSAVYPLTIDPTFGYESVGVSSSQIGALGPFRNRGRMGSVEGLANSVTAYLTNGTITNRTAKFALYVGTALVTNGTTGGVVVYAEATAWRTDTFGTEPTVDAETNYWMAMAVSNTDVLFLCYYDSVTAGQGYWAYDTTVWGSLWPDPWVNDANNNNRKYSIYCTYTETPAGEVYSGKGVGRGIGRGILR